MGERSRTENLSAARKEIEGQETELLLPPLTELESQEENWLSLEFPKTTEEETFQPKVDALKLGSEETFPLIEGTGEKPPPRYAPEIEQEKAEMLPTYPRRKTEDQKIMWVLWVSCLALVIVVIVGTSVVAQNGFRGNWLANLLAHPTPTGQKSPKVLLTSTAVIFPTPTPQAQSVQPFPTTLSAEIATLEAHNRFFYNGNTALPEIALTFDDGPSPAYTPQVLAILKQYHVKATFFDVGRLVQAYPQLARQELGDGNVVGNHSWSHADLPTLSPSAITAELQRTSDQIQQVTGVRPTFMRPPYGDISTSVLTVINNLALTTVIWNDEAQDWALPGTPVIVARILRLARNGAIILLHDGGGNRLQTVAALPSIIQQLRARGYTFVTMDQMVARMPQPKGNGTPTPKRKNIFVRMPESILILGGAFFISESRKRRGE